MISMVSHMVGAPVNMGDPNLNPDDNQAEILKVIVHDKRLIHDENPSVDIIDLDFFNARYIYLKCNSEFLKFLRLFLTGCTS